MGMNGKFSEEFLGLTQCDVTPSQCIYNRPTRNEIEELCAEKGIESKYIPTVIKIFNNIEGSRGGAAEPSSSKSNSSSQSTSLSTSVSSSDDSLSPSEYVSRSGYTQSEQKNYVDRVLLALALGGGTAVVGIGLLGLSSAQDFLVSQGIMYPLCKGPLDRVVREAARQLEPALAGPSCDERLKSGKYNDVAGRIPASTYGSFTWANWEEFRKTLKDRILNRWKSRKR